jgi:sugar lactone lactonase YvrE
MNVNIFRFRRFAGVIAALMLTCGASSPAWCKSGESLWAANTNDSTVLEFSPSELKSSGSPTPVTIDSAAISGPEGVAFDKSGNLWVSQFSAENVLEFSRAQLKNLGTVSNPTPNATIASTMFQSPDGCTFDRHGNLWIVDYNGKAVRELSSAQLEAGSNADITPAINITSSTLEQPNFGVFDKTGDLWVSNEGNSEVVEFSASQLGSSGAKTPTVVLSSSSGSLDEPAEMAFDSKGNLWVSNFGNSTVVMFAKKELSASGSPTPKVTLSSAEFDGAFGLAFDSGHNLWVSNIYNGNIGKLKSKHLKKSGSPTPGVVLTGVLAGSYQMIFGPVY